MVVRVGIIGAGKVGLSQLALANTHPDADVVAVSDGVGLVLSTLKKHARLETHKDPRELIEHARIDAVLLTGPPSTHASQARLALERGLHVLVERPLSLSASESRALAELARSKRKVAQVAFHLRFAGPFREARRLVAAGALGRLLGVSARAESAAVTREGARGEGGAIHELGSGLLDLMAQIAGAPSKVLGARLQSVCSRDADDVVSALLAYPNGMSGALEASWSEESARRPSVSLSVRGAHGRILADRGGLEVFLRAPFEAYGAGWTSRHASELELTPEFFLRGEEHSHTLDAFLSAILGRAPAAGPGADFAAAYEIDRLVEQIVHAGQSPRPSEVAW